jgi:copper(I)-binding protein
MNRMVGTALAVALLALVSPALVSSALAGDAKLGQIEITTAWARATPPRPPVGGAYMTITNSGAESDHLIGASSGIAKTVELHTHVKDGAVMRMSALSSIEVPAGKSVSFAPGGLHVMLIGLAAPLKEGTSFPLVLEFANAGKVSVSVDVKAIGAASPASANMPHDPSMHDQHMGDPAYRAMHEQHMKDAAHRTMHEQMHGK